MAEFLYDTLADFINKFIGNTKRTTTHIVPSASPSNPLTVKEYIQGDIPSGAKLPKKTTPEIKWHRYLEKIAKIAPKIFLLGKKPAMPNAKYGNG